MPPKKTKRNRRLTLTEATTALEQQLSSNDAKGLLVPPFALYDVQQRLVETTTRGLLRREPTVAVELPTGCGKTMALLFAVLRFQRAAQSASDAVRRAFYVDAPAPSRSKQHRREVPRAVADDAASDGTSSDAGSDDDNDAVDGPDVDDGWCLSAEVRKRFGALRREPAKKTRLRGKQRGPKHRFPQIFYATRTHAQVSQVVTELGRLRGGAASGISMNILASRDRYCINHRVTQHVANDGNNLGEVCDKLVAVNQCTAVSKFIQLGAQVLHRGCSDHNYGGAPSGGTALPTAASDGPKVWAIEDLKELGMSMDACPYYAARELVYDADISLCTYQYLFDPIIRNESKFERAVRHSVVVVDEAHNIADVCRDALTSTYDAVELRFLVATELLPLLNDIVPRQVGLDALYGSAAAGEECLKCGATARRSGQHSVDFADHEGHVMDYPRGFTLNDWTLLELLVDLFHSLAAVLTAVDGAGRSRGAMASSSGLTVDGSIVLDAWRRGACLSVTACAAAGKAGSSDDARRKGPEREAARFRSLYALIHELGVTFNPFNFSVHTLMQFKRLLLAMRFLFVKPHAFTVLLAPAARRSDGDEAPVAAGPTLPLRLDVTLRCLCPSLAYGHLQRTVSAIVLASGTLGPMPALAAELDIGVTTAGPTANAYEGAHVVDASKQVLARALGVTSRGTELCCTYQNQQKPAFVDELAETILVALARVPAGALVLFPSFGFMETVLTAAERQQRAMQHRRHQQRQRDLGTSQDPTPSVVSPDVVCCDKLLLGEPRGADAFTAAFRRFRTAAAQSRGAALFAVHRGKVSEGLNFSDDMARAVLCVGVPFRPLQDPLLIALRGFARGEWYSDDAVRAVNQGLGRVIRHRLDWGALLLLDVRFATTSDDTTARELSSRLSSWVRPELQPAASLPRLVADLDGFFAQHRQRATADDDTSPHPRVPAAARSTVGQPVIGIAELRARAAAATAAQKSGKSDGAASQDASSLLLGGSGSTSFLRGAYNASAAASRLGGARTAMARPAAGDATQQSTLQRGENSTALARSLFGAPKPATAEPRSRPVTPPPSTSPSAVKATLLGTSDAENHRRMPLATAAGATVRPKAVAVAEQRTAAEPRQRTLAAWMPRVANATPATTATGCRRAAAAAAPKPPAAVHIVCDDDDDDDCVVVECP